MDSFRQNQNTYFSQRDNQQNFNTKNTNAVHSHNNNDSSSGHNSAHTSNIGQSNIFNTLGMNIGKKNGGSYIQNNKSDHTNARSTISSNQPSRNQYDFLPPPNISAGRTLNYGTPYIPKTGWDGGCSRLLYSNNEDHLEKNKFSFRPLSEEELIRGVGQCRNTISILDHKSNDYSTIWNKCYSKPRNNNGSMNMVSSCDYLVHDQLDGSLPDRSIPLQTYSAVNDVPRRYQRASVVNSRISSSVFGQQYGGRSGTNIPTSYNEEQYSCKMNTTQDRSISSRELLYVEPSVIPYEIPNFQKTKILHVPSLMRNQTLPNQNQSNQKPLNGGAVSNSTQIDVRGERSRQIHAIVGNPLPNESMTDYLRRLAVSQLSRKVINNTTDLDLTLETKVPPKLTTKTFEHKRDNIETEQLVTFQSKHNKYMSGFSQNKLKEENKSTLKSEYEFEMQSKLIQELKAKVKSLSILAENRNAKSIFPIHTVELKNHTPSESEPEDFNLDSPVTSSECLIDQEEEICGVSESVNSLPEESSSSECLEIEISNATTSTSEPVKEEFSEYLLGRRVSSNERGMEIAFGDYIRWGTQPNTCENPTNLGFGTLEDYQHLNPDKLKGSKIHLMTKNISFAELSSIPDKTDIETDLLECSDYNAVTFSAYNSPEHIKSYELSANKDSSSSSVDEEESRSSISFIAKSTQSKIRVNCKEYKESIPEDNNEIYDSIDESVSLYSEYVQDYAKQMIWNDVTPNDLFSASRVNMNEYSSVCEGSNSDINGMSYEPSVLLNIHKTELGSPVEPKNMVIQRGQTFSGPKFSLKNKVKLILNLDKNKNTPIECVTKHTPGNTDLALSAKDVCDCDNAEIMPTRTQTAPAVYSNSNYEVIGKENFADIVPTHLQEKCQPQEKTEEEHDISKSIDQSSEDEDEPERTLVSIVIPESDAVVKLSPSPKCAKVQKKQIMKPLTHNNLGPTGYAGRHLRQRELAMKNNNTDENVTGPNLTNVKKNQIPVSTIVPGNHVVEMDGVITSFGKKKMKPSRRNM